MTNLIDINLIETPKRRQRVKFDPTALQELVTSIQESAHGLMQAPILRTDGPKFILVAGERRLRAIRDIYDLGGTFLYNGTPVPKGQVPYTLLGDLSFAEAWEAELEENIRREDLTWPERAAATAEWMDMRRAQAEENGTAEPTTRTVADELRPDETPEARLSATKKELIVAKFLHDPEVKAATSVGEAYKILKKKETRKENENQARVIGKSFTAAQHVLLNENSADALARLPAGTFDIILSDPPYGMGADQFGDSGQGSSAAAHFYDDSYENWIEIMSWFLPRTEILAKADAHMYLFCDFDRFHELKHMAEECNWTVFRTPLIWHNTDGFRAPWPDKGPQRRYECILYAVRGEKRVNLVAPDVLTYKKDAALGHPAQKPVALLEDLLRRSAKAGQRVLDPFAGSGATIEACHNLLLTCTAIEQDGASFAVAARRLASLSTTQTEIPA